jgi:HEPN domain-containing protein
MTVAQFVKQWVEQAEHDLQVAHANRQMGFHDTCIVLCQQSGEKYLKALSAHQQSATPPRTHELGQLARSVGAPANVIAAAVDLSAQYLAARYPDVAQATPYTLYTDVDADEHLRLAQEVQQWVLTQLPSGTP